MRVRLRQGDRWRRVALRLLALCALALVGRGAVTAYAGVRLQAAMQESAWYLQERVILIDPGHGGADPGAVGVGGTLEKELTLQIAQRLAAALERVGARPVLARDRDMELGAEGGRRLTIREELTERVKLAEKHGAHLLVSIHANRDRCNCFGAQTFYQRSGMPDGRRLAHAIQEELRRTTWTRRVALPIDHYVLRIAPVPAATVEVGFLSNAKEEAMLKDPAYQERLAGAILLGLGRFLRESVPDAQAGGTVGN
jgi:N-acetylmuramoyl-L-alanine amidase